LGFIPDTWDIFHPSSLRRNEVIDSQGRMHMLVIGTESSEWGHYDSVLQQASTNFDGFEEV